jgi:hypothetical protein
MGTLLLPARKAGVGEELHDTLAARRGRFY